LKFLLKIINNTSAFFSTIALHPLSTCSLLALWAVVRRINDYPNRHIVQQGSWITFDVSEIPYMRMIEANENRLTFIWLHHR